MRFIHIAFITLLLILTACTDKSAPQIKPIKVAVYKVPAKNNHKLRHYPAITQASDLTHLSLQVSGELIQLPVKNGQRVKQGQLLAKLDPSGFQLSVNERQAKVTMAQASMQRAKTLVKSGNLSASTFDELAAQYRIALAELNYVKLQLKHSELRAPFDGSVAQVMTENYQSVNQGQTILTLHKIGTFEVKVDLPDAIFSLADTKNNPKDPSDLKLKVSLDAYQDDVFYGLYKQHTTEQNGVNKSYSLTLNLANPNNLKVLAGMPASVEIDLAKLESQLNNSIKLPIESVIQPDFIDNIGTERIVWRLNKQQQVEMVKVFVVGVSADNSIEVTGPIKPDDLIVINGFNYLSDGLPVEVINLAGVQP